MPTGLTPPVLPINQHQSASLGAISKQLHDQHAEFYAFFEAYFSQMYADNVSIKNRLNALATDQRLLDLHNVVVSLEDKVATDNQLVAIYNRLLLMLSTSEYQQGVLDLVAAMPDVSGLATETTLQTRATETTLESINQSIGTTGFWSVREVLEWLRGDWEDAGGPYELTTEAVNIRRCLTDQGAGVSTNWAWDKLRQIYDLLDAQFGGGITMPDLSTIETLLEDSYYAQDDILSNMYNFDDYLNDMGSDISDILQTLGQSGTYTIREAISALWANWSSVGGGAELNLDVQQIFDALTDGDWVGRDTTYDKLAEIYSILDGQFGGEGGGMIDLYTLETTCQDILDHLENNPWPGATGGDVDLTSIEGMLGSLVSLVPNILTATQAIQSSTGQVAVDTSLLIQNGATNARYLADTMRNLDFCCPEVAVAPDPVAGALPGDMCQRAQWFVDQAIDFAWELHIHTYNGTELSKSDFTAAMMLVFGKASDNYNMGRMHRAYAGILADHPSEAPNNDFQSIRDQLIIDKQALVCALQNSDGVPTSKAQWRGYIETNWPLVSGFGDDHVTLFALLAGVRILNDMADGLLPSAGDLSGYSADFCDSCSGGAGGTCYPTLAGDYIEKSSVGVTDDIGWVRQAIEWDSGCGEAGHGFDMDAFIGINQAMLTNDRLYLVGDFFGYAVELVSYAGTDHFSAWVRWDVASGGEGNKGITTDIPAAMIDQHTAGIGIFVISTSSQADANRAFTVRLYAPGSFTAPVAASQSPEVLQAGQARLHGSVNPNGIAGNARFRWGYSPGVYTEDEPANGNPVSGSALIPVNRTINYPSGNMVYYQVYVTTAGGTVYGNEVSFQG